MVVLQFNIAPSKNISLRKKNDILLNLQNHKYNLKCCNRATGDDIRSLILSMHPE